MLPSLLDQKARNRIAARYGLADAALRDRLVRYWREEDVREAVNGRWLSIFTEWATAVFDVAAVEFLPVAQTERDLRRALRNVADIVEARLMDRRRWHELLESTLVAAGRAATEELQTILPPMTGIRESLRQCERDWLRRESEADPFDLPRRGGVQSREEHPVDPLTMPDTWHWEQVVITFTSEHRVMISIGGSVVDTRNYEEMGFRDARTGKPNRAWNVLLAFSAQRDCELLLEGRQQGDVERLRKRIQEIRSVFRVLFSTDDDPIKSEHFGYRSRFRVERSSAFAR